jgi:peroxiredoxin
VTTRQQWAVVLGIVAVLAGALVAATRLLGDELFPVGVGSPAPAFSARTLTAPAVTRTLDDYRGQVVLLNVWATWCGPCRVEMPSIERLHRAYAPQGLRVVAVSIDDPGMEERVRAFAGELGLTFEILHDPGRAIDRAYQVTGYPETFVIGSDGVIRKKVIGPDEWDSPANRRLVASLLGVPYQPPAAAPADSSGIPLGVAGER